MSSSILVGLLGRNQQLGVKEISRMVIDACKVNLLSAKSPSTVTCQQAVGLLCLLIREFDVRVKAQAQRAEIWAER